MQSIFHTSDGRTLQIAHTQPILTPDESKTVRTNENSHSIAARLDTDMNKDELQDTEKRQGDQLSSRTNKQTSDNDYRVCIPTTAHRYYPHITRVSKRRQSTMGF